MFGSLSYLPLRKEAEDDLIGMTSDIVKDINEIWNDYEYNGYSLTSKEITELQARLEAHQIKINEYIEKYSIVKQCSRCNNNNFFLDF